MNRIIKKSFSNIAECFSFTQWGDNYFRRVNDVVQSFSVEERRQGPAHLVLVNFAVAPLCFPYLCSREYSSFGLRDVGYLMQPREVWPFQYSSNEEYICAEKIERVVSDCLMPWFEQFSTCQSIWDNRDEVYKALFCRTNALTFAALKVKDYAGAQENIRRSIKQHNKALIYNLGLSSDSAIENEYRRNQIWKGICEEFLTFLNDSTEEEIESYIRSREFEVSAFLFKETL